MQLTVNKQFFTKNGAGGQVLTLELSNKGVSIHWKKGPLLTKGIQKLL